MFCLLTMPAPAVVFHRLHDKWEVGPELPFPGWIGDAQLLSIVLSHVHPELQLQRGGRLLYHRNIHDLHVRTRSLHQQFHREKISTIRQDVIRLHPSSFSLLVGSTRRQEMMGGGVHTSSEVIMRKRSGSRGYADENIRDSIVMGDLPGKFPDLGEP